jgi:cellulose synthase/poly-beta-1,6-N-acetylglucosamine synthase-like glycosyltransferase
MTAPLQAFGMKLPAQSELWLWRDMSLPHKLNNQARKLDIRLSVIIANYNYKYRDFVGAAIERALAVDWPDKEVIVVDDASTDDSRTHHRRFPWQSGGLIGRPYVWL